VTRQSVISGALISILGFFGVVMGTVIATKDPHAWPAGLIFGGFGLVVLAAAVGVATAPLRHRKRERERGRRLQTWGLANGWTYEEAPLTPKGERHAPGTRLRLGLDRLFASTVDGMPATAAEASYLRARTSTNDGGGTTTSYTTVYMSVFALRLPGGPWPDVSVRPRPLAFRLVGALANLPQAGWRFGYGDFDERFLVEFRDPAAPRVFSRPLLDAHLAGHFGSWRIQGGELIVDFHDRRPEPAHVPQGIQYVRGLASLLARPAG